MGRTETKAAAVGAAFTLAADLPVVVGSWSSATSDALVALGSAGVILLLLALQVRGGLRALHARHGVSRPVISVSVGISAGALVVNVLVFAVLAHLLGTFDLIDHINADGGRAWGWGWGPQLALNATVEQVSLAIVTGFVVIAVVGMVQRVQGRRAAAA